MRASKLVTYGIEFTLYGDGADVVYDREVSVDPPRIKKTVYSNLLFLMDST